MTVFAPPAPQAWPIGQRVRVEFGGDVIEGWILAESRYGHTIVDVEERERFVLHGGIIETC